VTLHHGATRSRSAAKQFLKWIAVQGSDRCMNGGFCGSNENINIQTFQFARQI
jgi:hypothetical protein